MINSGSLSIAVDCREAARCRWPKLNICAALAADAGAHVAPELYRPLKDSPIKGTSDIRGLPPPSGPSQPFVFTDLRSIPPLLSFAADHIRPTSQAGLFCFFAVVVGLFCCVFFFKSPLFFPRSQNLFDKTSHETK